MKIPLLLILFLSCSIILYAPAIAAPTPAPFTEDATQKADAVIASLYAETTPAGPWVAIDPGAQRTYYFLCEEKDAPRYKQRRRTRTVVLAWDGTIAIDNTVIGRWDTP